MNELGRRYFLFASTPRGRQRILVGLIVVACLLDVVASLMARSNIRSHTVGTLYSVAGGILLFAVIFLFSTRRSR
jgi:undecaprenyl pyrophosphate phosphatase UppP